VSAGRAAYKLPEGLCWQTKNTDEVALQCDVHICSPDVSITCECAHVALGERKRHRRHMARQRRHIHSPSTCPSCLVLQRTNIELPEVLFGMLLEWRRALVLR
jgi:hypothetical protein